MRMAARLDCGGVKVSYKLADIRKFDAGMFLRSGRPGATLWRCWLEGGPDRVREILKRLAESAPREGAGTTRATIGLAPVRGEVDNWS